MSEFDERGRPIQTPQPPGQPTYPGNQGGTNWYSPSYSPRTGLFYVPAWEDYATHLRRRAGRSIRKGGTSAAAANRNFVPVPGAPGARARRGPINNWTEAAGHGAVLALDPTTGEQKWKFAMTDVTDSGILTTASDLLFTGGREGYFQALDARTGALLWKTNLGAADQQRARSPTGSATGSTSRRLRAVAVRVRARRVAAGARIRTHIRLA